MPVEAPPAHRSLQQRIDALKTANGVRTRRCEMKAEFKKGADPIPLLANPPEWLATMKVERYLVALPGVGEKKAKAILRNSRISTAKTVGGLSDRQRDELVAVLGVIAANLLPARLSAADTLGGPGGVSVLRNPAAAASVPQNA